MQFNRRTVTSRAGMGQEEALLGLQSHPEFKQGSTIAGIRRRGERWVISVLEPKDDLFSEDLDFPENKFDEKKEEPKSPFDAIDEDHEEHEKSESPMEEKEEHEDGSEVSEIKDLIKDVKKIIEALGINDEEPKAPGMEDVPAPPPAPAHPAPKGDEENNEKEVVLHKSMRPGEAPPGTVNVGSPAFASTKVASFTATSDDTFDSIKQAKASLESEFGPHGYKVKQLRRSEGKVHALLSVR